MTPAGLSVSIVTYAPDLTLLAGTLRHLDAAARYAKRCGVLGEVTLFLVDNGPGEAWRERLSAVLTERALVAVDQVKRLDRQGNVGYGAGHNLAFKQADAAFHLILNPDVWLAESALSEALGFMAAHPEAGLLAPAVTDGQGDAQYLCRRYPTVFDLWLRGFAPLWLKRRFRRRLTRYELRDKLSDTVVWDVPLVSGCFMLFRRSILARLQGFSAAYFLYFEDYDLSMRTASVARIAYVPAVQITHFGGNAARKGWRHRGLFIRSAVTFFSRHGWKWV